MIYKKSHLVVGILVGLAISVLFGGITYWLMFGSAAQKPVLQQPPSQVSEGSGVNSSNQSPSETGTAQASVQNQPDTRNYVAMFFGVFAFALGVIFCWMLPLIVINSLFAKRKSH